jgi:hypothetical protein
MRFQFFIPIFCAVQIMPHVIASAVNEFEFEVHNNPGRKLCIITVEVCTRYPAFVGKRDDSDVAYQQLDVGRSESACLSRPSYYWEMCRNSMLHPIVSTFLPTGKAEMYPSKQEVSDAKVRHEHLFTDYNYYKAIHTNHAQQSMGIMPGTTRFLVPAGMTWAEAVELLPPGRGSCRIDILTCHLVPTLSGRGDDFEHAYADLQVGADESACLSRARYFWTLCGGDPFQQANATFQPTGAHAAFPEPRHARRSLARRYPGLTLPTDPADAPAPAGLPRGAGWRAVHVYVGPSAHVTWAGPRGWMGECLQDLHVMRLLGYPRAGFFVDLAAHDAAVYSNTLAMEEHYGWHGICIEPLHRHFWGLRSGPGPSSPPLSPSSEPVRRSTSLRPSFPCPFDPSCTRARPITGQARLAHSRAHVCTGRCAGRGGTASGRAHVREGSKAYSPGGGCSWVPE